jgi:uncharacterized protein (DUF433 family)
MIDWSKCDDAERSADTLHGAWRVKGHRIPMQAILDNAEAGCCIGTIAAEIYPSLTIEVVRRIVRYQSSGFDTTGALALCAENRQRKTRKRLRVSVSTP